MWNLLVKFAPYILGVLIITGIVGGFLYFQNRIETLQYENGILLSSKIEAENNYTALNQLLDISNSQTLVLRKNEEDAVSYIANFDLKLNQFNFSILPNEDLKNKINEYEFCSVKNFLNPSVRCWIQND